MGQIAIQPVRSQPARTQEERTETAKQRLREAALELFGQGGYEATTLAAISIRAGYSRALAQYHYPDKESLALELLEDRIRRDNHLELLACPDDAAPEVAWQALKEHLDAVSRHYGALHADPALQVAVRGEMALHAAALMTTDKRIKVHVHHLTVDLIARIERLLMICRTSGFVKPDTDCHAVAVLHVHSIWGLALAMFANPRGTGQVLAALRQIAVLMEGLRSEAA